MRRALLIALLLAAATPALADDPKAMTEQGLANWIATYNKGDAAALTALYTSDANLMPQGVDQPIVGEAAIRSFFDGFLKQRLSNLAIPVTTATQVDPNHIVAMGTWSGEAPGQNGAPATKVGGTWLSVTTKQGNDWKLSADTWNMMPPPAATAAAASSMELASATDVEGVKAASQAFYAALNARDAGAMAKVYAHTPFAVHIPPMGSDMAVGWDAVNKSWEDVFTKVAKQINIAYHRTDGPQIDGNTAWEVGTEKGPLTFMDGKTADFNLMVTNIYQKTDGRWQLVVHQAAPVQK